MGIWQRLFGSTKGAVRGAEATAEPSGTEEEVLARAGLEPLEKPGGAGSLPVFVHRPSAQRFVRIPGGAFVMGWPSGELRAAFAEVGFDPGIDSWAKAHQASFEQANPLRVVRVEPFLCGCSPLLGATVEASGKGVRWSVHESAEPTSGRTAAAMSAGDASEVLAHYGWSLLSEAQWEYLARCGGTASWAVGEGRWRIVDDLRRAPSYCPGEEETERATNPWGIWGLALGEWVADEWHESYRGAPPDARPWRTAPGVPGAIRGGGVLHSPWQDSDEAICCHAAYRGGTGRGRGCFAARPVIALPGSREPLGEVPALPRSEPFRAVLEAWADEVAQRREAAASKAAQSAERARRLACDLPGAVCEGTVRSVSEGVAVIALAEANGVLRGPEAAALVVGQRVNVRVLGSGRVPEVALVPRPDAGPGRS